MTVRELLGSETDRLAELEVESPRLQVELILAHVLQIPRFKLYLNFEHTLVPSELATVHALIRRCGRREPIQHLLGSTSFCGLEIKVGPPALIPRPETELLAERAWVFLNPYGQPTALDFGTGTGCLAIALAVKCPFARLVAVDISPEALLLARDNAVAHGVAERVHLLASNGFSALRGDSTFDLIVANPPYIPSAEIQTLAPEVREHEPRLALDGGADGLDHYRRLAVDGRTRLRPRGRLMLELGDGQAEPVKSILSRQRWIVEWIGADYTGQPRLMVASRDTGQ